MDDSRHGFEPPELTDREVAQSIVESGEDNVPIFKDLQELEQLLAEDDIGTSDQPAAQIHDTALLEPSMQELESTLSEARATLQGSLANTRTKILPWDVSGHVGYRFVKYTCAAPRRQTVE